MLKLMENKMQKNGHNQHGRKVNRSIDGFIIHLPKRTLSETEIKKQNVYKKELNREEKQQKVTRKVPNIADRERLVAVRETKKNKSKAKRYFKIGLISFGLLVLAIVGFVGFRALHTIDKVFHGNIISDTQALFSSQPLKGEENGRVNILLAGDSSDDPGHQGGNLTDSIVVLSIDTKGNNTFMLSIPRDLWVKIPGNGTQKINAANVSTASYPAGYPQNGMGVLEYVVNKEIGIPINYYALANYSAFRDAVNDVGGVRVNIQSVSPYGLYDPYADLKLKNGWVNLNGQQALNLARARGDGPGAYGFPESDFDRTSHQRMLFTAIAQKALSLGVLSNPIKISNLFNSFSNNVKTDLSLQNILRLRQVTKNIDLNNIQSHSFCSTMTTSSCNKPIITTYQDPASGQSALIPILGIGDYSELASYYQLLSTNNPVIKESPSIVVLNGTNKNGFANEIGDNLTKNGFNVLLKSNARGTYNSSLVINLTGGKKPNSLKYLTKTYQAQSNTNINLNLQSKEAIGYNADFVIILGS